MVVESSKRGRWVVPFAALSIGAVLGTLATLLLMPESAAEHRQRMARRVDKALKLAEMNSRAPEQMDAAGASSVLRPERVLQR